MVRVIRISPVWNPLSDKLQYGTQLLLGCVSSQSIPRRLTRDVNHLKPCIADRRAKDCQYSYLMSTDGKRGMHDPRRDKDALPGPRVRLSRSSHCSMEPETTYKTSS